MRNCDFFSTLNFNLQSSRSFSSYLLVALSKDFLFLVPDNVRLGLDAPIGADAGVELVGEGGLRKIKGVVLIRPSIWLETLLKFSSMVLAKLIKQKTPRHNLEALQKLNFVSYMLTF